MSSSVATVSAYDRTAPQDPKRILAMQTPDPSFDLLNPNVGWVIGPIAVATNWVGANLVNVDLSWAELLYSVAAVIYAKRYFSTQHSQNAQKAIAIQSRQSRQLQLKRLYHR